MFIRLLPKLVAAVLVTCALWSVLSSRPIHHPPGVLVPNAPVQKDIPAKPLTPVGEWGLTAVAEYQLRGRVLGTKRYHSGAQSDLVPVDVALGWGKMSDQSVLDRLTIS